MTANAFDTSFLVVITIYYYCLWRPSITGREIWLSRLVELVVDRLLALLLPYQTTLLLRLI